MRPRRSAFLAAAAGMLLSAPIAAAAPLGVLASFLPMYLFTINVVGDTDIDFPVVSAGQFN